MREEVIGIQGGGNGFVVREFHFGIGRQRTADGVADGLRTAASTFAQQGVFGAALHERDERAGGRPPITVSVSQPPTRRLRSTAPGDPQWIPVGDNPAPVVGP